MSHVLSGFDYRLYSLLYDDVSNDATRHEALAHYKQHGQSENRVCRINHLTSEFMKKRGFTAQTPHLEETRALFYRWLMKQHGIDTHHTSHTNMVSIQTTKPLLSLSSKQSSRRHTLAKSAHLLTNPPAATLKSCDYLLCIHLYPYFILHQLHTLNQITHHISQSSEFEIYQKQHIQPHHIERTHFLLNHFRQTYGLPECSLVDAFYMFLLQSMSAIEALHVRTNAHYGIIDDTVLELSDSFVQEPSIPERTYNVVYEDDISDISNVVIYAAHIRCKSWCTVIVSNLRLMLTTTQMPTCLVFVCSVRDDETHMTNYYVTRIQNECRLLGIPVVVLLDVHNKLFDFGKYWMGMHYIHRFSYKVCTIANDSVIVCDSLHRQWAKIQTHLHDQGHMVGMLESSEINRHYQSWWISMNPMVTRYMFTHMTITKTHKDTVNGNEVALGNKCIRLFHSKALCSYKTNVFFTNYPLHREYVSTSKCPFIKYKQLTLRPDKLAPDTLEKIPVFVPGWNSSITDKVLISYVYFQSPTADVNFTHFIEHESKESRDDVDYVVVIQGFTSCLDASDKLPTAQNWHIIRRPNTGYDFGGHAATLDYLHARRKRYSYHMFMNSGVIGPFLTPETQTVFGRQHWSTVFMDKINNHVKLVGTTVVNLSATDLGGKGPKVESFCFATDYIGLSCFVNQRTIFTNHPTKEDAIVNGEYGLSRCIFKHGYTIDCLIPTYSGIDWTNPKNHMLNDCLHPSRNGSFFGRDISPYEVVMHKWYWHMQPTVSLNVVLELVPDLLYRRGLGIDYDQYRARYADLQHMSDTEAFVHWMTYGSLEGRVADRL